MKGLFLAHHHDDAGEVRELGQALRLYGIRPWIDKDGGFSVGDGAMAEARRAIREDCFGLLVYASHSVLDSAFIRDVEVDEKHGQCGGTIPSFCYSPCHADSASPNWRG